MGNPILIEALLHVS